MTGSSLSSGSIIVSNLHIGMGFFFNGNEMNNGLYDHLPALLFQTLVFVHIVLLGQLVLAAKLQENHVSMPLCKSCPRLNRIASVYEM